MAESPPADTDLFTGVVSIVPTRRRRFRWAAWFVAPPEAEPFRRPDAESGGARTRAEALAQAERAAGQRLVEIDGRWAGAWVRLQRGEKPWPKPRREGAGDAPRVAPAPPEGSRPWALALLGVGADASAEEKKRAFRALALRTHPDHGGDDAAFIEAKRALEVALAAPRGGRRKRGG